MLAFSQMAAGDTTACSTPSLKREIHDPNLGWGF